mgnify:CR=1 FL=1
MGRYLSLVFIFSICLGDTVILKNDKVYKGKLIKYVDGRKIMFRALPSANILINIDQIHELKLTDGTKIFENGEILVYDLKSIEKYRYEKAAARGLSCLISSGLIFGIVFYFIIHIIDHSPDNTGFPPPL